MPSSGDPGAVEDLDLDAPSCSAAISRARSARKAGSAMLAGRLCRRRARFEPRAEAAAIGTISAARSSCSSSRPISSSSAELAGGVGVGLALQLVEAKRGQDRGPGERRCCRCVAVRNLPGERGELVALRLADSERGGRADALGVELVTLAEPGDEHPLGAAVAVPGGARSASWGRRARLRHRPPQRARRAAPHPRRRRCRAAPSGAPRGICCRARPAPAREYRSGPVPFRAHSLPHPSSSQEDPSACLSP